MTVPEPVPALSVEVVEVSAPPSSSRPLEKVPTLLRDPLLTLKKAKSVVLKDDIGEYDKVNTDVVKMVAVHSLMKEGFLSFLPQFFLRQVIPRIIIIGSLCKA